MLARMCWWLGVCVLDVASDLLLQDSVRSRSVLCWLTSHSRTVPSWAPGASTPCSLLHKQLVTYNTPSKHTQVNTQA